MVSFFSSGKLPKIKNAYAKFCVGVFANFIHIRQGVSKLLVCQSVSQSVTNVDCLLASRRRVIYLPGNLTKYQLARQPVYYSLTEQPCRHVCL